MLIHLEKLGKSFGEKIVLHDVTASVEREDRIGIVGRWAQHFTGETVEHFHQHLLLVRQRQVEQRIRVEWPRATGGFCRALSGQAEAGATAAIDQFFERFEIGRAHV